MTASRSPRVLAWRAEPDPSENSSSVSRPSTTCSAELGHGAVPIGVGHPLGQCRRARSAAGAGCQEPADPPWGQFARFAWSGRDLTPRQSPFRHPLGSSAVRGILSAAGYVPYRRLARSDIKDFMGSGGGKGTRAVASHDEDTTTLGVEAARLALRSAPGHTPETVWFATSVPAYLDKTNATAVAAALRLPGDVGAYDFGGALRSGVGCLIAALRGRRDQPGGRRGPARRPADQRRRVSRRRCGGCRAGRRGPRRPGRVRGHSLGHATNSPIAGGPRATARPSSGRSASGRTATWLWAKMPWPGP